MNKDIAEINDLLPQIKEHEQDFIKIIKFRLGIVIHQHQMTDLHKVILNACKKFDCLPYHYLEMLQNCCQESPLLEHLISGITVGETYFFRDKNQMGFLNNILLPKLIKQRIAENNLSLRIWSAGCASGEEIYSIAIMLLEQIPDINAWNLNLLGTDINTASLKKAMTAKYSEWSMRSIIDYYKEKYFRVDHNQYFLAEKVVNLVKFDYHNLNEDSYPSILNGTNAQDLIICRNVLIYFDSERIAQLMSKLSASLILNGSLILGASDPINIKDTELRFHSNEGVIYFTRETAPSPDDIIKTIEIPQVTESYQKPSVIPPKVKPHHVINKIIKQRKPNIIDENTIIQLMTTGKWSEVVIAIDTYEALTQKTVFTLNNKAKALANLGKLTEAAKLCEQSLELDKTNIASYFIYALILSELNKFSAAEQALRKILFLDHEDVIAHYQLGLMLLRNKKYDDGLKYLHNALNIVKNKNHNELVAEMKVFSHKQLVEMLEHEIDLYTKLGSSHHANNTDK